MNTIVKFCSTVTPLFRKNPLLIDWAVYGEARRYPLYINRYVQMIKFWGNVLKTDNINNENSV